MKALKFILPIGVMLFILTGCTKRRPEWREFSFEEDFSIMMPAEPRKAGFKVSDGDEEVRFHVYKAKSRGHKYKVMTSNVIEEPDVGDLMDIGFELKYGKFSIEERDFTYNGYPGKEFTTRKSRRTSITRYFVLDDRFYLLSVRYKNRYLVEEDVERFFNSFKVKDHPPAYTAEIDTTG
ncbi:hypothetical protein GF359_09780 [candidate division WOR-3 bacterium]|uniref:Lipoprotein n=1 Tax=candidate division WOR-3 bacterium TaxID=2052148 RepID=A0A9D5QDC8_UNCW3|nr:hypothetical protein [candidate division WOR-3 bacterium]MBD3365489.1 hypothetical protein [candidate division WOR-3 bacterium]